jgi:mono/diheme cytochrome c family protein
MSPVVHAGLAALPDSDIRAQAIYFADIDHAAAREPVVEAAVKKALATSPLGSTQEYDPDARLYVAACIACHYNAGPIPLAARPELALNSALTLPEPSNFIHVVLDGIDVRQGGPGLVMPGYAAALTDTDIARLAAYLRRTRTDRPPWSDVEQKVAAVRQQAAASE